MTTVYIGEPMTVPQVPTCAKNYSYIDGCNDLTSVPDKDVRSVSVTVPAFSMDCSYTVTFMVCTDNDTCFTTTTPLGE